MWGGWKDKLSQFTTDVIAETRAVSSELGQAVSEGLKEEAVNGPITEGGTILFAPADSRKNAIDETADRRSLEEEDEDMMIENNRIEAEAQIPLDIIDTSSPPTEDISYIGRSFLETSFDRSMEEVSFDDHIDDNEHKKEIEHLEHRHAIEVQSLERVWCQKETQLQAEIDDLHLRLSRAYSGSPQEAVSVAASPSQSTTALLDLQDELSAANAAVIKLKTDLAESDAKAAHLVSELSTSNSLTDNLTREMTALQKKLVAETSRANDLSSDLQASQNMVTKMEEECLLTKNSISEEVQSLQAALTAMTADRDLSVQNAQSLQNSLNDTTQLLGNFKTAHADAEDNLKGEHAKSQELQSCLKSTEEKLLNQVKLTDDLEETLSILKSHEAVLTEQVAELEESCASGCTKIVSMSSSLQETTDRCDKMEEKLAKADGELQEYARQCTELSNMNRQLLEAVNSSEASNEGLAVIKNNFETAKRERDETQSELNSLKSVLMEKEKEMKSLKEEIGSLKEKNTVLTEMKRSVKTMEDELLSRNAELLESQQHCIRVDDILEKSKTDQGQAMTDLNQAQTQLTELQNELHQAEGVITDLEAQLENDHLTSSKEQEDLASLKTQISGLERDLEKSTSEATQQLMALENDWISTLAVFQLNKNECSTQVIAKQLTSNIDSLKTNTKISDKMGPIETFVSALEECCINESACLADLESTLEDTKKQLVTVSDEAEDTALQHVALFDVLNRLAEDPSKPAGGIAKLFPVVSTVKDSLLAAVTKAQTMEDELESVRTKFNQEKEQMKSKMNQLSELVAFESSNSSEVTALNQTISQLQAELASSISTQSDNEATRARLQKSCQDQTIANEELQESCRLLESKIQSVEATNELNVTIMAERDRNFEQMADRASLLEAELRSRDDDVKQRDQALGLIKGQLKEALSTADGHCETIQQLRSSQTNLEYKLKAVTSAREESEASLQGLQNGMQQTCSMLSEVESDRAKDRKTIESLNEQLVTAVAEAEAGKQAVAKLSLLNQSATESELQHAAAQNEVLELKSKIETLETKNAKMTADLTRLKKHLLTVEAQHDEAETNWVARVEQLREELTRTAAQEASKELSTTISRLSSELEESSLERNSLADDCLGKDNHYPGKDNLVVVVANNRIARIQASIDEVRSASEVLLADLEKEKSITSSLRHEHAILNDRLTLVRAESDSKDAELLESLEIVKRQQQESSVLSDEVSRLKAETVSAMSKVDDIKTSQSETTIDIDMVRTAVLQLLAHPAGSSVRVEVAEVLASMLRLNDEQRVEIGAPALEEAPDISGVPGGIFNLVESAMSWWGPKTTETPKGTPSS